MCVCAQVRLRLTAQCNLDSIISRAGQLLSNLTIYAFNGGFRVLCAYKQHLS